MATVVQGLVSLVARLMLTAIFIIGAVDHVRNFTPTNARLVKERVPLPRPALIAGIGLLFVGSVSVASGAWTRIGAGMLLLFLTATTYFMHDFWTIPDPNFRMGEMFHFMKNVAIGGGLLMLVAFGAGPWSVDGWIEKKQEEAEGSASQRQARSAVKG